MRFKIQLLHNILHSLIYLTPYVHLFLSKPIIRSVSLIANRYFYKFYHDFE